MHKVLDRNYRPIDVQYNRAHLAPAQTFSARTLEEYLSTFAYTNAVPQHKGFSGQWSVVENNIRQYASTRCINVGGTLFLLTGTSFAYVLPGSGELKSTNPKIKTLLNNPDKYPGDIYIPNSMWTAGCCVLQDGNAESFAVIGNNDKKPNSRSISVTNLQKILLDDVTAQDRKIGGKKVDLFPGNGNCLKKTVKIY